MENFAFAFSDVLRADQSVDSLMDPEVLLVLPLLFGASFPRGSSWIMHARYGNRTWTARCTVLSQSGFAAISVIGREEAADLSRRSHLHFSFSKRRVVFS